MNSVFVGNVKIPFSHLLKQAYPFSYLSELLFFSRTGKIYSNIYYNKAQS